MTKQFRPTDSKSYFVSSLGFGLFFALGISYYFILATQRPDPFTPSTDGLSYFLPLISSVHNHWLSGTPLKVLWDLGAGWVPWESGQIGYLYPGYTLAQSIADGFDAPLKLLEISAAIHLGLIGAFAWLTPPAVLDPLKRTIYALTMLASPGLLAIGMNWHNYLTPMPWFVLLIGLVFQSANEDRALSPSHAVLVLLCSALFFTASHPQMYVLGISLLTLTVLFVRPKRSALYNAGIVAVLQLPFIPSLAFLHALSIDSTPIWAAVRTEASLIDTSTPLFEGILSMVFGIGSPAFFNPVLVLLIAAALLTRRYLAAIGAVLFVLLILPAGLPTVVGQFLEQVLQGFRWPGKLTVFAGPLMLAALVSLRLGRPGWILLLAIIPVMFAHDVARQYKATSLTAMHQVGVQKIASQTQSCLDRLSIQEGDRIAFVGKFPYRRDGAGLPPELHGIANNAPILFGLRSLHMYDPLEPADAAESHHFLTCYWRKSLNPDELTEDFVARLERDGVDVLFATYQQDLVGSGLPIEQCSPNSYAVRLSPPSGHNPGLLGVASQNITVLADGSLLLRNQETTPQLPVWRINQRPDRWEHLGEAIWRWNAPWPAVEWLVATGVAWLFALALAVSGSRLYRRFAPTS